MQTVAGTPRFEVFSVEIEPGGSRPAVLKRIEGFLGGGATVEDTASPREVGIHLDNLSVADAWAAAYGLREMPGVAHADPLFEFQANPLAPSSPAFVEAAVSEWLVRDTLPVQPLSQLSALDTDWALRQMGLLDARQKPPLGSDPDTWGRGVRVVHPDTGYTPHPELGTVNTALARNTWDPNRTPHPELDPAIRTAALDHPGHGTAAGSVVMSSPGRSQTAPAGMLGVEGVAPAADYVPVRITTSVVAIASAWKLARAYDYAREVGAGVVFTCLGTLGVRAIRTAIERAQADGIIVVSAAGNEVGFVVYPAAWETVIAVAACNEKYEIWRGSSRGRKVDVVAPGENVWCARSMGNPNSAGSYTYSVGTSDGTTFAAAHTAGLAALWLSVHGGYAGLKTRHGIAKAAVPEVFQRILKATARLFWDPRLYGSGLIDADAVLAADPAAYTTGLSPAAHRAVDAAITGGTLPALAHLFEPFVELGSQAVTLPLSAVDLVERRLQALFSTDAAGVRGRMQEVGDELVFRLSTDPALYRGFGASLFGAVPGLTPLVATGGPDVALLRERLRGMASPQLAARLE